MAGLDPLASVSERYEHKMVHAEFAEVLLLREILRYRFAPADAGALGGRVKPGHGEFVYDRPGNTITGCSRHCAGYSFFSAATLGRSL